MKAILEAIYGRFTAEPPGDLYTGLGGQLYADEAPQGTRLPYGVFALVAATPVRSFTETQERAQVRFDLYAADQDAAADLYEDLLALFEGCALSPAGYQFLKMERIQSQQLKEPHCWRWMVSFHVWAEEA